MILSSHQPNFLPYMGFFYKIYKSDCFVLSDDHQFSKNGMHNFNYIRIGDRKHRITVPVSYSFGDKIRDVRINYNRDWVSELLKTLEINYKRATYFNDAFPVFETILKGNEDWLLLLNMKFIIEIIKQMKIATEIKIARTFKLIQKKDKRIIELCNKLGADTYYSGIGGKLYNNPKDYEKAGIKLIYTDYHITEYPQIGKGFIENLSVLDWIFNMGFTIPEEWSKP
jgi:hypothetical protein|nr:MAG TPA: WbqC-like protein [Caudoviricetes sp.]